MSESDAPVTRAELIEVANIAEAALLLAAKLASEHRVCDAPAGDETPIHDRLETIRSSHRALDSMELRSAVELLQRIVPYNE